jgi:threonine/homoserine/homoserine lactone efflux protein
MGGRHRRCLDRVPAAGTLDLGSSSGPSAVASWVKLGLGVLLLLLAAGQWRSRPAPGQEPSMPKWMSAIDSFTPVKAAGLGFLLAAVNPKNLLMCVAAGSTIAGGALSTAQDVWSVVVFTVLAASTVAVPVIGYAIGRKRMAGPLESLRGWLTAHNVAVMATLLLVIGVVLIGKGLGGLV